MTSTDISLPKGTTEVDECFENNAAPLKRIRLEQNQRIGSGEIPQLTVEDSKLRANKFLRMHLQILRALYAEDSSSPFKEDSEVEESEWSCIDAFLRERDRIQTIGSMVHQMGSIREEAVKFQQTVAGRDPPLSMTVSVPITSPGTGRTITCGRLTPSNLMYRSSLMIIAQASARTSPQQRGRPQLMCDRTNSRAHFWTSTTPVNMFYHPEVTTVKGRNNCTDKVENETCKGEGWSGGGDNAFGIISGLLKRKHQSACNRLKKKSVPYRSLLLSIYSRIQDLEVRLKDEAEMNEKKGLSPFETVLDESHCHQDRVSFGSEWTAAKERAEESKARMQTKIYLWQILLYELKVATE
jgi:hypothetical protein